MPTFWTMPCKRTANLKYRNGWARAVGERWRVMKEVPGPYRHITRWFPKHDKKLPPNPNKARDKARWRRMGYE